MINLINAIFMPITGWLRDLLYSMSNISVPLARPINFGAYFGYFSFLGPVWITFITTVCTLGFIYFVIYLVMSSTGLYLKFKNSVKWW